MRIINIIVAAIFALFLSAPLLSLAVIGYSPLAENPYSWKDIDYSYLVSADDRYRKTVLKKLLTDTPLGMAAVSTKSIIDLDIFDYVETDQVISGRDGWLYFKSEFDDGDCLDPKQVEQGLDMVEGLLAIASTAGIKFAFSVSPDKSVAQSEFLGSRARAVSGCKIPSAENWRHIATASGSHLIDHLAEFRAANLPDHTQLYLKTDTHWNEYAQAIAARGWSKRWLGVDPGMPGDGDGKPFRIKPDLGNNMLRLNRFESTVSFASFWEGHFNDTVKTGIRGAVVLHDSFYTRALPSLRVLFPDAVFFDLNHPRNEELVEAIAARPKYLLVNSVERRVFFRLTGPTYDWSSPLGRGLLKANERATMGCNYENSTRKLNRTGMSRIDLPGTAAQSPCLRISMPTSDGLVQILLPADTAPMYRSSYSIIRSSIDDDDHEWNVVLPAEYAGKTVLVRADFTGGEPLEISVGTVSRRND